MNENKISEKLQNIVSSAPSKWREEARYRKKNKSWLKRSQVIALKILTTLREMGWSQKQLAEKMDISPQTVNKWVKGRENFTLETISKLEDALRIELMQVVGTKSKTLIKSYSIALPKPKNTENFTIEMNKTPVEAKVIPLKPEYRLWEKSHNKVI